MSCSCGGTMVYQYTEGREAYYKCSKCETVRSVRTEDPGKR